MNIETKKQDGANAIASGVIAENTIQARLSQLSSKAAKTMKVDGFRKGKVPAHVIQTRFGEQLRQDAEQDMFKEFVDQALQDLSIDQAQLMGNPKFLKFDKTQDGIALEIRLSLRPNIDLQNLSGAIPAFNVQEITQDQIDERLRKVATRFGTTQEIQRAVQNGDIAQINFEGFIGDVPFEGGKAESYPLEIGSQSFISGFEEGIIGMKKGESKDIHVTFPEQYGNTELAGKPARFAVTVLAVQERKPADIDDSLAKNALGKDDATLDSLKEHIKDQLTEEEKAKLYNSTVKEEFIKNLLDTIDFDLPQNIVEQEIDVLFRNEVNTLEQKELESLKDNADEVKKRRDSHEENARKNVKLTLIVDAIAREKGIKVTQQEVWQTLYQEAMAYRQDPKEILDFYEKNGLLPAVQMAILENKVLTTLLDDKQ